MKTKNASARSTLLLLSAAVFWSTAGLFVKFIPWSGFSVSGFRGLTAGIAMVIIRMFTEHKTLREALPHMTRPNVLVGLCVFMVSTSYITAIKLTTAANAIVLQYLAPVFVLLYAVFFRKQKLSPASFLLTAVVFGGCVLTFAGQLSPQGTLGNCLAVFAGLCFAAQIILSRAEGCDPQDGVLLGCFFSALLLPCLFFEKAADLNLAAFASAVALAVIQYAMANLCYARGMQTAEPVTASLLLTLEPVLNPVWVWIFTGEQLTGLAAAGFVLVLGGAGVQSVLANRSQSPRK